MEGFGWFFNEMQYQPEFAFLLPLEDDEKPSEEPKYSEDEEGRKYTDDEEGPLTGIEIETPNVPSKRKQKNQVAEPIVPPPPVETTFQQKFIKVTWYVIVLRWHILSYLIILAIFYLTFQFAIDKAQKEIILSSLAFCDDWKQLVFFFGLYVSFAVKKVSDVSSVSIFFNFVVILPVICDVFRIFPRQIKSLIYCLFAQKAM